jgi:hypothetical protein
MTFKNQLNIVLEETEFFLRQEYQQLMDDADEVELDEQKPRKAMRRRAYAMQRLDAQLEVINRIRNHN